MRKLVNVLILHTLAKTALAMRVLSRAMWMFVVLAVLAATMVTAVKLIGDTTGKLYFLVITLCGALGGILYSTKDHLISLPHQESVTYKYDLGFLSDIVGGVGGAYIIFMILPFDFQHVEVKQALTQKSNYIDLATEFQKIRALVQVIAVSMLGGYGGRALMEKVENDLLRKNIENVDRDQKALASNLKETNKELALTKEMMDRMCNSTVLISRILDIHYKPTDDEWLDLKRYIQDSDPTLRKHIFYRAKDARQEQALQLISILNEGMKDDCSEEAYRRVIQSKQPALSRIKDIMAKSIRIFQYLSESDADPIKESTHRYYAQWAYSEKDLLYAENEHINNKKKWSAIRELLDRAISLRKTAEAHHKHGDSLLNYGYYELNKAISLIELDGGYREGRKSLSQDCQEIRDLLAESARAAKNHNTTFETIFPVNHWIKLNDITISSLSNN